MRPVFSSSPWCSPSPARTWCTCTTPSWPPAGPAGGQGPVLQLRSHQRLPGLQIALNTLVLVVPVLIGMFWGAPLIARELETGTFRLAWTQSVSRVRWLLVKLGLVGLAAIVVAGGLSLHVHLVVQPHSTR